MKKPATIITSLCFIILLAAASVFPAVADEGGKTLNINGDAEVNVGDVVTYTLYLSDATVPIVGFQLQLFYDSEYLQYQQKSLTFEKFGVVFYNENIDGRIPMNSSQINDLPVFSEKTQFVSASFKVLKAGKATITEFFTDLYGEDMTYLKKYKLLYDLSVNGKVISADKTPPVDTRKEVFDTYGGDFINYADGMGDENSPKGEDHKELVMDNGKLIPYVKTNIVEVTHVVPKEEKDGGWLSQHFTLFIVIVSVVVTAVVASVVTVVVTSKKKGGKS